MKALPVYLIAGLPGSGKSTLLEHIINSGDFPKEKNALIINNPAPLNMDAKRFRGKAAKVTALTGACVCCAAPRELINCLKLYAADKNLQQVWVEASGSANLKNLLDCLADKELAGKIEIRRVIYMVDAESVLCGSIDLTACGNQAQWADIVLINKIDGISAERRKDVWQQIQGWNIKGTVLTLDDLDLQMVRHSLKGLTES